MKFQNLSGIEYRYRNTIQSLMKFDITALYQRIFLELLSKALVYFWALFTDPLTFISKRLAFHRKFVLGIQHISIT